MDNNLSPEERRHNETLNSWYNLEGARLAYAFPEPDPNQRPLNANLLKKLTGEDKMIGRNNNE